MKIALALLVCSAASTASAQITSVTDPSAYRPDRPAPQTVPKHEEPIPPPEKAASTAPREPTQAITQSQRQSAQVAALNLVCGGGGTANKPNVVNYYGSSNASGLVGTAPVSLSGSNSGTVIGQRQQDFADQVDVRLFSGDDRIRLPRTILPPIHGGKDGWFELTNVKVTDRAITASAGINFMNHPKVHIDRLTGTISINGKAGSYTGQCQAVDPNAQRKF
jgi:hypothetical protein